MYRLLALSATILFWGNALKAQDTLPAFTVKSLGEKVQVSWVNPYQSITQLNIQRSYDSLRNYHTIFSSPSPNLPQNGYTDGKAPGQRMFYRIFYVLEGGTYFFTKPQRLPDPRLQVPEITPEANKFISIRFGDSIIAKLAYPVYLKFKDSVLHKTYDSLFTVSEEEVVLKRYRKIESWKPSAFVYTTREGNVVIRIPDAHEHRYRLAVFNDQKENLFTIQHIKETLLTLDRANFLRAGWFSFELYVDDRLKESNRFYVPKDF
jgi:hypothetical protein